MLSVPSRFLRFVRPMVPAVQVLRAFESLPLAGLDWVARGAPVMVLAPHPDDESLGCGGLIAEACLRRLDIHVVVVTDGSASHPRSLEFPPARLRSVREDETRRAALALGLPAERVSFLGVRDSHAPLHGRALAAVASRIAGLARERGVQTLCATWPHDPHRDHLATHRMARVAAAALGIRHLSYPVWGWTLGPRSWLPRTPVLGARLDVSAHLAAKRDAIACHATQHAGLIRDDPTGFNLQPEFLGIFDRSFEVFVENPHTP